MVSHAPENNIDVSISVLMLKRPKPLKRNCSLRSNPLPSSQPALSQRYIKPTLTVTLNIPSLDYKVSVACQAARGTQLFCLLFVVSALVWRRRHRFQLLLFFEPVITSTLYRIYVLLFGCHCTTVLLCFHHTCESVHMLKHHFVLVPLLNVVHQFFFFCINTRST